MSFTFKVVCTDIDGTLLDGSREISDYTREVFRRLPKDVPVILASSRMPAAMRHLQIDLGVPSHPLICYNGGYVLHAGNDVIPRVMWSTEIPADVCRGIINLSKGTSIHTSMYYRDDWYAPRWDYWTEREATITKVDPEIMTSSDVVDLWESSSHGAHKIMCMGNDEEIARMAEQLEQQFGGVIHVYRSRPTYLELAPLSISKGTALQQLLLEKYQMAMNHVLAYGDNYNDIELLKLAGHGVAVQDSREEVKAIADEIAGSAKENGVALHLEKHLRYF